MNALIIFLISVISEFIFLNDASFMYCKSFASNIWYSDSAAEPSAI